MTSFWDKKYYVCKGHYHRITDHLMVNPFSGDVFPDQWCQGQRTTELTESKSMKGTVHVSATLWCDAGGETVIDKHGTTIPGHPFSSLDLNMEEEIRTRKVRNRAGDFNTVTVTGHSCGMHVRKFPSEDETVAIKNGEGE